MYSNRNMTDDSDTNRSRKKSPRKRAAGRKGTVDEYEYLLASIGRLVVRVDEKSGELIVARLSDYSRIHDPFTTSHLNGPPYNPCAGLTKHHPLLPVEIGNIDRIRLG